MFPFETIWSFFFLKKKRRKLCKILSLIIPFYNYYYHLDDHIICVLLYANPSPRYNFFYDNLAVVSFNPVVDTSSAPMSRNFHKSARWDDALSFFCGRPFSCTLSFRRPRWFPNSFCGKVAVLRFPRRRCGRPAKANADSGHPWFLTRISRPDERHSLIRLFGRTGKSRPSRLSCRTWLLRHARQSLRTRMYLWRMSRTRIFRRSR